MGYDPCAYGFPLALGFYGEPNFITGIGQGCTLKRFSLQGFNQLGIFRFKRWEFFDQSF